MNNFTQKIFGFLACLLIAGSLSAQAPFWTEDFDSGLPADWTAIEIQGDMTATSNWFWTDLGPTGSFAVDSIMSTTHDNGWMLFDSDLNCSGDQNAWLVSPQLDLSDKDIVVLQFEQYYRKFGDLINVQVSTDSTVWTQFPLFAGLTNNNYGDGTGTGEENSQLVTVNISSSAANQTAVWIAFQFIADATTANGVDPGCAYSWQIDDVRLIDFDPTPSTDLSMGDFFFPPLSFATPASQIATDTMGFSADVSNLGNVDVPNVVLKVEVTNGAGDLMFTDSVVADVIPVGTIDSTLVIATQYPPSNVIDSYTIDYSLYSLDSIDADMSNNSASEVYIVSDNTWAKEAGETIAFRPGGGPVDYDIGNMYTTSTDWVDNYMATEVSFNAATNAADGNLSDFITNIVLLEIDESAVLPDFSDFDDQTNFIAHDAMSIRSFNIHQYAGANFDLQTISLEDFDLETPGVELKPGNRYFLIASYEGANNVVFHGFSEDINYFQISTIIFNGQWFLGGFGPEPAAVLRMTIDLVSATDENLLPEETMTFFPNPASDVLNVEVTFEKPELANVTIADINGRVIQIDILKNVVNEKKQYDVSSLAPGTYLVRVATEEGTLTKKFVVVR